MTLRRSSYQGKITKKGLKQNYGLLLHFLIQISKWSYFNLLGLADFLMHHWFRPCCPPMSNPSISSWTARLDGSGRWDNRLAAQHLSRNLARPSSGWKNSLKKSIVQKISCEPLFPDVQNAVKHIFLRSFCTSVNAEPCERLLGPPKKIQMGPYSKHVGRCVLFRASCKLAPWAAPFQNLTKLKYNLRENNFNELPMQNKWKLTLSLVSCYHQ